MAAPAPALRAVAIDLDGTLFTPHHDYDRERFGRMLQECLRRDIHVVIASGRQYLSMRTMFDEPDRLAFVGDNGSMVVDHDGEVVQAVVLDEAVVRRTISLLDAHPGVCAVASGPEGGWMPADSPELMLEVMPTAYENLVVVDRLAQVDGPVSKFALTTDDGRAAEVARELSEQLDEALVPVTTGHRGIDLIQPGRHKAWGLQVLLERWGLGFDELVAFGDSGNDLEMLRAAGTSYAMGGASPEAVAAADHRAPSGADSGVMVVMEQLLGLA